MPKSPKQKLKLLYLQKILLEQTDEDHPLTIQQLIEALAHYGIQAERKSLYDDLEALRQFGLDILRQKSKTYGYYVGSRPFELPELKLLVDAVECSRFITEKKSRRLIGKIAGLASAYQAKSLQRQVHVSGRVKTMNESVYYNIDEIHAAISADRQISFYYFEWTVKKEKQYRKKGAPYCISPWSLVWDDENYYLLGYDEAAAMIKHYRVDKMLHITKTELPRQGAAAFAALDFSLYGKGIFGMFGGEKVKVTLECENALAGVILNRFGQSTPFYPASPGRFRVIVEVVASPQFYGWLFALGESLQVVAPNAIVDNIQKHTHKILIKYTMKSELLCGKIEPT